MGDDRDDADNYERDELPPQVAWLDAQQLAKQDARNIAHEGARSRGDDYTECQHSDEQQTDCRVAR